MPLTAPPSCRFNCGHWFARSEEDGSVERFLVANKVPQTLAKSGAMSALGKMIQLHTHTRIDAKHDCTLDTVTVAV